MAEEPTRILVLDDEPLARALVESILSAEGYRVSSTGDVGNAIRWAFSERGGFVITDILMGALEAVPRWERRQGDPAQKETPPPQDAYAILRPLQNDPDLAEQPLVCIRDRSDNPGRPNSIRFAIMGYVSKPVSPEELLERIASLQPRAKLHLRADTSETEFLVPDMGGSGEGEGVALSEEIFPNWEGPISAPAFESLPKALRTALMADRDASYRQFLKGLLEPSGFTLYEATDGEDALKVAMARRPWLILTEVNMPRMDGFEFCRRVRSHSLLRQTPLVFLSAWDEYRERYHGLSLGADDYLSKKTDARELLIRLQITLKRYSDVGTKTRKGAGMEGGIELIGAPGMLQMCHLGRFTGVCTIRSGSQRVQIRLREGEILSAESNLQRDAEAIFEFLSWTRGHFDFQPGDPGAGEALVENFDYLLLEGCRRLDESARAAGAAQEDRS